MQFSKKASLNLSINAIVILILAITMLGLGLGFMKGMFGKVTGELEEMTKGLAAERKAELEASLDRVTFQTTELEIKRGTQVKVFYAIRNNLDDIFEFDVAKFSCSDSIDKTANYDHIVFEALGTTEIESGSSIALPLIVKVSAGAIPTIYSCDISIPHPDPKESGTYVKKKLYITVTP